LNVLDLWIVVLIYFYVLICHLWLVNNYCRINITTMNGFGVLVLANLKKFTYLQLTSLVKVIILLFVLAVVIGTTPIFLSMAELAFII
jgi:hypothetical protein